MRAFFVVKHMKNTVLFCTGLSGSGKSYFVKNILPKDTFYSLKSATTRPMRDGEADGREYYFRDEQYFDKEKFATYLFVNEYFWKPGDKKWLYGVPEFEIREHWGQNFVYDVIQPKYVRQLMAWFNCNDLRHEYDFRVLWFMPPMNNFEIAKSRQNMPNDLDVRKQNTCNYKDFQQSRVSIDHIVTCNPHILAYDDRLRALIESKRIKTH